MISDEDKYLSMKVLVEAFGFSDNLSVFLFMQIFFFTASSKHDAKNFLMFPLPANFLGRWHNCASALL